MMTDSPQRARLTAHTSDETAAAFGILAAAHRRSVSAELALAIEAWLELHIEELRSALEEVTSDDAALARAFETWKKGGE